MVHKWSVVLVGSLGMFQGLTGESVSVAAFFKIVSFTSLSFPSHAGMSYG